MDEPLKKLDTSMHILMLEHLTLHLWANILSSQPDPVKSAQECARGSLSELDTYAEKRAETANEAYHPATQLLLHHTEYFWAMVEDLVQKRAEREGKL
ncbi:hypothetical protein D6851_02480 [Altericroceibacterium spongiae]|uniref:Uncharacterized protein n=1 Tax=Altericroceibacterium spongiae TaxID=2320269 RepID=A0A420ERQ2_9SPHN|nr:hypothetical protein [Altericroceibacterium spongiae]RKF23357.1 hypothetical protein D6851_02480 [Altericroceibacterium spongiae]